MGLHMSKEQIRREQNEELLELLEHLEIYQLVKEREQSREEEIPLDKLMQSHDL